MSLPAQSYQMTTVSGLYCNNFFLDYLFGFFFFVFFLVLYYKPNNEMEDATTQLVYKDNTAESETVHVLTRYTVWITIAPNLSPIPLEQSSRTPGNHLVLVTTNIIPENEYGNNHEQSACGLSKYRTKSRFWRRNFFSQGIGTKE